MGPPLTHLSPTHPHPHTPHPHTLSQHTTHTDTYKMVQPAAVLVVLAFVLVGGTSAATNGLSDDAVVSSSPNILLSGPESAAQWSLSAPASDGSGCDTVADTGFNTTKVIDTVTATDAAACCSACRAQTGCLASVLSPATQTCALHNETGLGRRVYQKGSQACFMVRLAARVGWRRSGVTRRREGL